MVQIYPHNFKMADGRHLEKKTKMIIFCNKLTDIDEIWYSDAPWPSEPHEPIKFANSKIQDGGQLPS